MLCRQLAVSNSLAACRIRRIQNCGFVLARIPSGAGKLFLLFQSRSTRPGDESDSRFLVRGHLTTNEERRLRLVVFSRTVILTASF